MNKCAICEEPIGKEYYILNSGLFTFHACCKECFHNLEIQFYNSAYTTAKVSKLDDLIIDNQYDFVYINSDITTQIRSNTNGN